MLNYVQVRKQIPVYVCDKIALLSIENIDTAMVIEPDQEPENEYDDYG